MHAIFTRRADDIIDDRYYIEITVAVLRQGEDITSGRCMVDSKALWHQGLHSWRLWIATIAWKLLHVLHQYALFSTSCVY